MNETPNTPDKAQLLRGLSPFVSAYLMTALWSSIDENFNAKAGATAKGWTVHGEETPAGGPVKWVSVAPGENGADFVHDFEFEGEAWRAAADEAQIPLDTALDRTFSVSDFSAAALVRAMQDCAKFERENGEAIAAAIATGEVVCGPDFGEHERAGHDFWLTRNGHGAGFWDGDWPAPYGDALSEAARGFGELHPYVSDAGEIEFE